MNSLNQFLNLLPVCYYPGLNYISHEEFYYNLNIDIDPSMPVSKIVNIHNEKIYWEFLIEMQYLNEEFFEQVRTFFNLEPDKIDANILPKNVVCSICYKDNQKYIIWLNEENKKKFEQFIKH